MAETLLAVLLVTSSPNSGPSLAFRWPPHPTVSPRLARPRLQLPTFSDLDNPWRAILSGDLGVDGVFAEPYDPKVRGIQEEDLEDYEWKRPNALRDRSQSHSHSASVPPSGRSSPQREGSYDLSTSVFEDAFENVEEYDSLLGYSAEFLGNVLCPPASMCHQKFELTVDDLAFVGHPVCADADGIWRDRSDRRRTAVRGRDPTRGRQTSGGETTTSEHSDTASSSEKHGRLRDPRLHTFHFVLVLDRPDPSSSASGNLAKYIDVIYNQLAFTFTAVLYQEQIRTNFVQGECDALAQMKDRYTKNGRPFSDFVAEALATSSIATAMKALYTSVKESSIAYIAINQLPFEFQLPPYLDEILRNDEHSPDILDWIEDEEVEDNWNKDMTFGWRLPALTPWKSLLLLDNPDRPDVDPYANLREPQLNAEDRQLAEGLLKFLETASIYVSLAEMADYLGWELESQLYPTVRWLVMHRRAKVVDMVHPQLRTVFTLAPNRAPIAELASEFKRTFGDQVLSLPVILSTISASTYKQSDNHFFATVVRDKHLIPLYQRVVEWMLKKDLLVGLHLRIRIVATTDLKIRVRDKIYEARRRRNARLKQYGISRRRRSSQYDARRQDLEVIIEPSSEDMYISMSPHAARERMRRVSSVGSAKRIRPIVPLDTSALDDEDEDQVDSEGDDDDQEDEFNIDDIEPSVISDPRKATSLQRRWLSAMSDGKNHIIARRFEDIYGYFDGKRTDDEILFRADISRKQLREVLHHYDEYLQTFLHPS
ncbi:hypothetical protein PUNSTDRAFT_120231 [Punctularia strigosozonata HHB-11173 SS5]|uniref:uncharacterized protein n=1 Tax=Punctularia strigosozonata (strain HHB-11173) TaxID=741275 RepID=UPI00044166F1|nr:uncharacterized protein PUNSTDRAFT_120231 [Punctularia strigosozonata HHB-11173 SS5]EIN09994.1 hypothetical protein PUNSTDRAFT_120231 [Punctularia strigosozonata HHB-11173 SS5]